MGFSIVRDLLATARFYSVFSMLHQAGAGLPPKYDNLKFFYSDTSYVTFAKSKSAIMIFPVVLC